MFYTLYTTEYYNESNCAVLKTVLFNVCVYLDNGENEQPHPQLAPSSGIQGEMKILNEHSPPLNHKTLEACSIKMSELKNKSLVILTKCFRNIFCLRHFFKQIRFNYNLI